MQVAFKHAGDHQTSSLEPALIPVGRLTNVEIAWHIISYLILTVLLSGITGLILQVGKRKLFLLS